MDIIYWSVCLASRRGWNEGILILASYKFHFMRELEYRVFEIILYIHTINLENLRFLQALYHPIMRS